MWPAWVDEERTKYSKRLLYGDKRPLKAQFCYAIAHCLRRGKIRLGVGLDGHAARRVYR